MASSREIILVCDSCETEDRSAMVETHRVTVDGQTREAEMCAGCWQTLMAVFLPFASGGRTPEKRKVKKSDLVEWPDTPWKFTHHAMKRLGERKISPRRVLKVIAQPELTRPGKFDGDQIWVRDGIQVVVNPDTMHIFTASHCSSDYDELQAVG